MSDVIVRSGKYSVDPLYQWDKNQVLTIYGLSLASIPEIHFANAHMKEAIIRQARMDDAGVVTVDIPDLILQNPYKITAYVCVYDDLKFNSLYAIDIPVQARIKPADYIIEDPEEIYSFNALENRVLNALEATEQSCNETLERVNESNSVVIERANELINHVEDLLKNNPGTGGQCVPGDWNQNDETAGDYVKNRTHYTVEEGFKYNLFTVEEGCVRTWIADMGEGDASGSVYLQQVTHRILTREELMKSTVGLVVEGHVTEFPVTSLVGESGENLLETDDYISAVYAIVAKKDNAEISIPELGVTDVLPNAGTYILDMVMSDGSIPQMYMTHIEKKWVGKKLDSSYMPDDMVGKHGLGENSEVFNANHTNPEYANIATGVHSHAQGRMTTAGGLCGHAEGDYTFALGNFSHSEGGGTVAIGDYQHVQGKHNIPDNEGNYLHIVGNGKGPAGGSRSNAHTIDWGGNAWFAGTVEGTALILTSPNGTRFRITVDDNGTLSASAEPTT